MSYQEISPSEVELGMYVRLPVSWWKHPFARNAFRVQSSKDLTILKELDLKVIEYDPEKSSSEDSLNEQNRPSEPILPPAPGGSALREFDPEIKAQAAKKERQLEFLKQRRQSLARREQEYSHAFTEVTHIIKSIDADPEASVASAQGLMTNVVDTMLHDEEAVVHLIHLKERDTVTYFHSLNVCILSLILGKKMGLSMAELNELGLAALFHDIGKQKIPTKILLKMGPLTKAEEKYLRLHPRYGLSLLAGNPNVTPRVLQVVYQHHERCDGKGYPQGLTEHHISYLAKITSVVNVYDNLINQERKGHSYTPHEALSFLYTQIQGLSKEIVSIFIKSLGVYPPGTLVELSDRTLGMVITTDPILSMKPTVILYDERVPREEPFIINLADEDEVSIARCLRPSEVPAQVITYLQPGRMVGFFVGSLASADRKPKRV
jgi:HD-GYP domain-containing protein (c-di-GMP phosphodiesterase class II)